MLYIKICYILKYKIYFSHLNLKICNSKNIINKRFRILSTQTTSGRFLGIFSLTDAMKYQMHPQRVSVHLWKLKIRGCEELSTSVDQRMLITTDRAFEKRERDNAQKTQGLWLSGQREAVDLPQKNGLIIEQWVRCPDWRWNIFPLMWSQDWGKRWSRTGLCGMFGCVFA